MPSKRGIITNRKRAKQIRDFSGLRYRNITPTDIDGLIEYHNKAYILIEIKYGDAELPNGQKLALKRLTDDLESSGKPTLFIIASHQTSNCNNDIDVAKTIVSQYRFKKEWYETHDIKITTRQLIDIFHSNIRIESKELKELIIQKPTLESPSNEPENEYYKSGMPHYKIE